MAWTLLPTDYTDAVWSGLKKYTIVQNSDDTISLLDVTNYSNRDNSFFGAKDANSMNEAINTIMTLNVPVVQLLTTDDKIPVCDNELKYIAYGDIVEQLCEKFLLSDNTLTIKNGGTGAINFTLGSYLIGNGTDALQEKTAEEVASDIKQYLEVDTSNLVIKPTLLWSNASPTSAFSAQTVTLSQSIENFTHFSVMYGTYKASLGLLHTGLIPKDKLAVLQANMNYISYRNCSISANKATFTDTTYQWDFGESGSRGTNEFYCMPIYIYGWNL